MFYTSDEEADILLDETSWNTKSKPKEEILNNYPIFSLLKQGGFNNKNKINENKESQFKRRKIKPHSSAFNGFIL
jgi:hypothetical protein